MRMQRRHAGVASLVAVSLALAACTGGGGVIDVGKGLCREVGDATAATPEPVEQTFAVLSQLIDGRWPSDHFPVVVDLSIAECR